MKTIHVYMLIIFIFLPCISVAAYGNDASLTAALIGTWVREIRTGIGREGMVLEPNGRFGLIGIQTHG